MVDRLWLEDLPQGRVAGEKRETALVSRITANPRGRRSRDCGNNRHTFLRLILESKGARDRY
jgi:hypothetical protein